jgi:hypothetical protein
MSPTRRAPRAMAAASSAARDQALARLERFVVARPRAIRQPLVWIATGPADTVLAALGERVARGRPLVDRARDVTVTETRAAGHGAVLFQGPDGRTRLAVARAREVLASPVDGTVETIEPGGVAIRADGSGLPGAFGWGQPVNGRLLFGVSTPDAELRASAVDVAAAGAIVVGGARTDIEALTRARAIGVRGIITGGLVGKDLRQLDASEARQRAGLHAASPFGLLVLDGYGRRPIPHAFWEQLRASEGQPVGIALDPPMVVLGRVEEVSAAPGRVRIAAGDDIGREGRLAGLAGAVRQRRGGYAPGAVVRSRGTGVGAPGTSPDIDVRVVPIADLERFE